MNPSLILFIFSLFFVSPASSQEVERSSDFGEADFPGVVEDELLVTYHDAWCRRMGEKCRVKFTGRTMQIDNYRGITREQLRSFRTTADGNERYFYVRYLNSKGKATTALFLFANDAAATEFGQALSRWYEQEPRHQPNFRFPNSQGPQEKHSR